MQRGGPYGGSSLWVTEGKLLPSSNILTSVRGGGTDSR